MSVKLTLKERAALVNPNVQVRPSDPNEAPRTVPGNTFRFGAEAAELRKQLTQLEEQLATAGQGVKKVPLSRLHKIPGRQRKLTPDAYAELRDNLQSNPMIEPISVEVRSDGDWDILSGNNRYDVCVELGRTEVEIFEIEIEAGKGDVIAFYANLLHPSLPDFEKYMGFKRRMNETGMDARKMASESGISEKIISALMAFDRLPKESIDAISKNPACIGSAAAGALARLTEKGKSEQVINAISSLMSDPNMTQDQAIKMASLTKQPKEDNKISVLPKVFRIGKTKYAEMRGAAGIIKISLGNAEHRLELQGLIEVFIDDYVAKLKEKKQF